MAVSPWAQIRQGAQPDTPPPDIGPWAPIPDVPAPVEGMAKPARVVEDPIASNIEYHQAEAQKYRDKLARPYGFAGDPAKGLAPNHNTKLGKVAHIFSEVGNIAGNIVAPNVMANIPGTQLYNESKQAGNTAALDKELGEKSLQEQQGAQTAHTMEETPQIAPNAEAQRRLQGQTGHHLDVESNLAEHPLPEYTPLGYLTPQGQATEMEKHTGAITGVGPEGLRYAKAVDKFQHVNGTVGGVPTSAFADPMNHVYVDQDGNPIPNFKPTPQVGMQGPIVVSGEGKVSRATPGTTLPQDFRTISQGGSQNIPTSQMRNMGEMAATVIPMAENVKSEVQSLAQSIGPAAGRWNDLMVNKGGTDFPEFAGLDTDLDLLSSAIVRTHFGARGGQQYREELRKMLGAAQSPEDLISRIDHADGWLRGYAQAGGAKVPATTNAPTQTGGGSFKVRLSDAMGLPQNKGKSEQEVEADVKKHGGEVIR